MSDHPRERGFALLLMLIIAVMGSLYAVTGQLEFASRKYSRGETTASVLKMAKEALIGYALTYRDKNGSDVFGYLPCPDLNGDGSADTGVAGCNGADGNAVVGLLPFRELGLPDLRDSDGNCLWYAVTGSFKATSSTKPTPVNWDTQGQFSIQDTSGNVLTQPNDANGGGAAVIFAVGPPLGSQARTGPGVGVCGVADLTLTANAAQYAAYIDGSDAFPNTNPAVKIIQGTSQSTSANDQVLWISPKEIFDSIKKRPDFSNLATATPVGQLNNFIQLAKSTLESRIQYDISNNGANPRTSAASSPYYQTTPTNQAGYTQFSGRLIGELPDLTTGSTYALSDGTYNNYYSNWKDQFRYIVCTNLNNYCLNINGLKCDGALLFGGEDTSLSTSGNPRPTSQRALANYFEGSTGSSLDLITTGGGSNAYTFMQDGYSTASRSTDVVRCLYTRAVSFSQDLASFQTVKSAGTTVTTVAGTSVTLATTANASPTNYGCFWYPTAVPFGNGLRIYFRFRFSTRREGFTFALADATSNPTTAMCGGASLGALGYSGNNGATLPIKYPKMAVEFDTTTEAAYNDPSSGGVSTRHITFDYWGTSAGDPNGTDDNVHGNGGSGGDPVNPVSDTTACITVGGSNKFCRNAMSTTQNHDARIDISRSYSSTTGQATYTLKAYFTFNSVGCAIGTMNNVTVDASSNGCNPSISDTITITDLSGAGEAMKRVFAGFTVAQGTAAQSVAISGFQMMPY